MTQVPRDQNAQIDALANLGLSLRDPTSIWQSQLSISQYQLLTFIRSVETIGEDEYEVIIGWTKTILDYLTNDTLPYDRGEVRKLRFKVSRIVIQVVLLKNQQHALTYDV